MELDDSEKSATAVVEAVVSKEMFLPSYLPGPGMATNQTLVQIRNVQIKKAASEMYC